MQVRVGIGNKAAKPGLGITSFSVLLHGITPNRGDYHPLLHLTLLKLFIHWGQCNVQVWGGMLTKWTFACPNFLKKIWTLIFIYLAISMYICTYIYKKKKKKVLSVCIAIYSFCKYTGWLCFPIALDAVRPASLIK